MGGVVYAGNLSMVNVSQLSHSDYVSTIDVNQFVQANCRLWEGAVYGTYEFIVVCFIFQALFRYAARRYPRLMVVKIRARRFGWAHRLHETHPSVYSVMDRLGLTYIERQSRSVFVMAANVMQGAIMLRVIQVWLNLKFTYHLI